MNVVSYAVFNAHGNQMTPRRRVVVEPGDNEIPLEHPLHLEAGWSIRYRFDGDRQDYAFTTGRPVEVAQLTFIGDEDEG